jgi:HEPN domain-containing protein
MNMNEPKANNTIEQANELLEAAREELSRPEEDVVSYMVCRNAFKAIEKYLTAFLMGKGFDIHGSSSMEKMIAKCQEIDQRFNDLNLDILYQTTLKEDVWMDMDTVKRYIDLAEKTKTLVG